MAADLLTDVAIRNAKPGEKIRKLSDGNGLIVLLHPNGSKYFQLRYTIHGKEKTLQLGRYGDLTLTEARELARDNRKLVKAGVDPVQHRRIHEATLADKASFIFEAIATEWLSSKNRISPSYRAKIDATLRTNIYPALGKLPINAITSPLLLTSLRKMEHRGALELMSKCRAWLKQIFDYAKATGKLVGDNPANCLVGVLKKAEAVSYPTFNSRNDAGVFLRRLVEYQGRTETKLAIWLLLLTAKRPSELRGAEWSEFDLDKGEWLIPPERMKAREPHVVTLSNQAVLALRELHTLSGYNSLLFPGSTPTKPISDGTLAKAFRMLWPEYKVVPHGCRHFFSTHANEHGQFRHDVIEAALAHKDKDAIRATYNRATYIEERRKLAQWWAEELEAMKNGAQIINFSDVAA